MESVDIPPHAETQGQANTVPNAVATVTADCNLNNYQLCPVILLLLFVFSTWFGYIMLLLNGVYKKDQSFPQY